MDNESQQFLKNLEERFNGKITYRTFATWFATDASVIRDFGVFMFKINDTYHYEDFERIPSLLGFPLRSSKRKSTYEKLEGSFDASAIKSISVVTKNNALRSAQSGMPAASIPEASLLHRLFFRLVTKVELQDGLNLFFELISPKEFAKSIEENGSERL
ncbi:MAG: hypothetical protein WDA17_01525 [Sphaerochaetaceae bacterium]